MTTDQGGADLDAWLAGGPERIRQLVAMGPLTGVTCWACDQEIQTFGYRVDGVDLRRRNRRSARRLVCAPCYVGPQYDGRKNFTDGHALSGTGPESCEHCGFPVVLAPDARRARHTCSEACRVALYRAEEKRYAERRGIELPSCQDCGVEMDGRSDQRYCSSSCRQRAYRRRRTLGMTC